MVYIDMDYMVLYGMNNGSYMIENFEFMGFSKYLELFLLMN